MQSCELDVKGEFASEAKMYDDWNFSEYFGNKTLDFWNTYS